MEQKVYSVIRLLYDKKRIFTFNEFYDMCSQKIGLSDSEIIASYLKLKDEKIIVEGSRLIKDEILANKTRWRLFEYINENPGYHFTHVLSEIGIGSHAGRWHLGILEKFGFIRSKKITRFNVYFSKDFPESRDEMVFLLRNDNAKKIIEIINSSPEINASQIEQNMDLKYSTIHYYLSKLMKSKLLEQIQENNIIKYKIKEHDLIFLEKFFDFKDKILDIPKKAKEKIIMPYDSKGTINVLREFDYVGGDIRFKIAVQNQSEFSITKIHVLLNSTEQYLVDDKVKTIDVLSPNESRGVDFILTPLTCGKSTIYATISYSDYKGVPQSLVVNPKEVWIKCPLVTPKHVAMNEILTWKKELLNGTSSIEYSNIPDTQAFKIALDQISALDLSQIDLDQTAKSATYSGVAKVTNQKIIVEINLYNQKINLNVWTSELKQATGFIAYIRNLIKMAVDNAKLVQVKVETLGQRIIDSFEISQRILDIFNFCKENMLINDYLILLGEIYNRLERSFPDIKCIDEILEWKEILNDEYRIGVTLPEFLSIKLQFQTLDWLNKILEITKTNAQAYKNSFDDQEIPFEKIDLRIKELENNYHYEMKRYSQSILKYLMVIHKGTGLTIYEKAFFKPFIDPDLVGGFLTAIQSFGSEISSTETSMKKLVYKNFQIEIEDGDYIRTALILNGEPTEHLLKQLQKYVKEFENTFRENLINWSGNLQVFKSKDENLEKIF
ncbi:MAG: hypothetical protein EAX96_16025 [Candidatus Lokiarchaeota archaeon]|nr:hypothetical protein [Candidatus Lokiarchaeota archaeon]